MSQISVLESVELTAYGIFNINMSLIISVSMSYETIIIKQFHKTVLQNVIIFGFYAKSDFNVCIYLQILVLLITGFSTLLQMKNHPIFLRIANDSLYSLDKSFKNVAKA